MEGPTRKPLLFLKSNSTNASSVRVPEPPRNPELGRHMATLDGADQRRKTDRLGRDDRFVGIVRSSGEEVDPTVQRPGRRRGGEQAARRSVLDRSERRSRRVRPVRNGNHGPGATSGSGLGVSVVDQVLRRPRRTCRAGVGRSETERRQESYKRDDRRSSHRPPPTQSISGRYPRRLRGP